MTIALAFFTIGCLVGWLRATRREGTLADRFQWAAAHGIPAGIVGLAVAVLLVRGGV